MRSLRSRLSVWFGLSFLGVCVVFAGLVYWRLDQELQFKDLKKYYPQHPDWKLHGNMSEAEVRDIMEEVIEISFSSLVPLIVLSLLIGNLLARKSMGPIASLNAQLRQIGPKNLQQKITLPEMDAELQGLLAHINDLLERMHDSFTGLSEYAAKVAHELRTPLTILRLKVEQAEPTLKPELAEELQAELHRLAHVVEQALLIAQADQGRLELKSDPIDLSETLRDLTKDFQLLAAEDGRSVKLESQARCWIQADPKYLKQILHNLLTNALKHGQGDIRVGLVRRHDRIVLTILNRLRRQPSPGERTLGLGLRVVQALARLQPDLRYRARCGKEHYAASLSYPTGSRGREEGNDQNREARVQALVENRPP